MKTFAIKWEEEILVTSQNKDSLIWYEFIQRELTETEQKENKKQEILKELWSLKQIKDWIELVGDDTKEIETKIQELINEYKTL